MNYELAKKLHDSGFPSEKCSQVCWSGTETQNIMESRVMAPNLSELIEACGDDFGSLEHFRELRFSGFGKDGAQWFAEKRPKIEKCDKCKSEIKEPGKTIESGKTPEEAVANLWLTLNEREVS